MFKKLFLVMLNKLSEFGELQSTHLYTDFANMDIKKGNEVYEITIKCKKVEENANNSD